jgi:hypothetical protein
MILTLRSMSVLFVSSILALVCVAHLHMVRLSCVEHVLEVVLSLFFLFIYELICTYKFLIAIYS